MKMWKRLPILALLLLLIAQFVRVNAQTSDPVFVGAGDISKCGGGHAEATARLLDAIPGTVFTLGDHAYPDGTQAQFSDCYGPTWGRHKSRTRPAPGNHDYHTTGASGYFGYFGTAASPLDNNCTSSCKGYYSYNLGAWHIIALNSDIDHTAGSPQEQWLRADLAANKSACTLAYWHKPRFSSGPHGNISGVGPFWDALYQYGADVVLNGHDHTYQRFMKQNPGGQLDPNGIREFVVGTGGASLYPFTSDAPNTRVRNNTTYGVLKLTLHSTSYDWQFVPIAGQTFTDSGTADCVSPGPTPAPTPTPTPGGSMHIGDLDGTSTSQGGKWSAAVTITAHDASHSLLANVRVTGTWSNGATGTAACTTGVNGQCTVRITGIRNGNKSVTFTVSSSSLSPYTYSSAANHDPDGSSNGTTVVVKKP